jgi:hypothetical protein
MFTVMRVRICAHPCLSTIDAYMHICVYVKEAWSHVLHAVHAAYDAFLCMYGCVYSCTRACMRACVHACMRACVSGHMHVGLVVASHVCARMRLARVCVLRATLRCSSMCTGACACARASACDPAYLRDSAHPHFHSLETDARARHGDAQDVMRRIRRAVGDTMRVHDHVCTHAWMRNAGSHFVPCDCAMRKPSMYALH